MHETTRRCDAMTVALSGLLLIAAVGCGDDAPDADPGAGTDARAAADLGVAGSDLSSASRGPDASPDAAVERPNPDPGAGADAGIIQGKLEDCELDGVTYQCTTISYGSHPLQDYELWLPNTKHASGQTPLVIYVHGGGYFEGDKKTAYKLTAMADFLAAGHAFATINYRLSGEFPYEKGVTGEYPAAMRDGATAVQDLRLRAGQFGFSPDKIAITGNSAGGGISLWVALHDDLKDPSSPNPRERQSTRVPCVALSDTQTTLNIAEVASLLGEGFQLDQGLPGLYGFTAADYDSDPDYYQKRYADSMYEASPISHLSADDDVKVLLTYSLGYGLVNIHSPEFGDYLAKGQPAALAATYSRKSLQDFAISFELKAGQKLLGNRKSVFDYIDSSCF